MKKFFLSVLCLAALSPLSAQNAYLETDFSAGIPSGFALYDEDGLEPSIDMKNVGFAIGTPWLALEEENGNKAAVSTSWYRKAGTSDDWMITPAFKVASAHATLSWKAKAGDPDYRDGYSIYISADASTPADFKKLTPALTVKKEKAEWTFHEISLAEYEGKTVRIAFVNNTRDRATLWIDDIFAGVPAALRIESTMGRVAEKEGYVTISCNVTNVTDQAIKGFEIIYQFGDDQTYRYKSSKTVEAGKSLEVKFDSKAYIERNATLPYVLTVVSGEDKSSASGSLTCFLRRVVAEEVTGVWCGYCVRGIVAMHDMKQMYPDTFLGIAVHGSAKDWEDPMDYTEYTNYLFEALGMSGYPHATVNRRKMQTGDPANISTYYEQILKRDLTAGLALRVDEVDKATRTLKLHTDAYFLDNQEDANYSIAYVLIENNVHKDAIIGDDGKPQEYNGWEQNNYYTGAPEGSMGGFESLPPVVPGPQMTYQDVARKFYGDNYEGFAGSIPASITAGTAYPHEYTITMPDNVMNDENAEIAALLINSKTGEIINADVQPLQSFFTGVQTIEQAAAPELRVARSAGALTVSSSKMLDAVSLYSTDGRMILSLTPAENTVTLDASALQGVYILRASAAGSVITKKISL